MPRRKDGYYEITAVIDGRQRHFYGKTKAEAISKRDAEVAAYEQFPMMNDHILLGEWCSAWLEGLGDSVTPKTIESYTCVMRHITDAPIGSIPLDKLRPVTFRMYWKELLDSGLSPRTVAYCHTVTSTALKQAVLDGVIPVNPLAAVKKPHVPHTKAMALTREQLEAVFTHISNPVLLRICRFAVVTGMRRSEILGLRWQDVNFSRKTVSVNQTCLVRDGKSAVITQSTKTTSSRRTLSIDDATIAMLREQKAYCLRLKLRLPDHKPCDLVFPSENLTPICPNNVTHDAKAAFKAAGLPQFSFHSFRHTSATLLLQAGINYKVVQQRLGHSSCATTMDIYAHVMPGADEEAAKVLDALCT